MIYYIILNELSSVFGISEGWQFLTLEIFSIILCIFFVILFLSIPLKLFFHFLTMFTQLSRRKGRRKRKNEIY